MFWVFLFLSLSSLLISRVLYRSFLSPIGILGLIWNGALALFEARLIDYDPLATEAYIAFIGSFLLFALSVFISTWPFVKSMRRTPKKVYRSTPAIVLGPRRARNVLNILNSLSLVGLTLSTVRLAQLVGWDSVFHMSIVRGAIRSLEATESFGGGTVGYLTSMLPLTAILGGVYLVQAPSDRLRASLCLFVSMLSAIISGTRTSFIWTSALFFTSYILTRAFVNREPLSQLIRPLLLGVGVLFIVFGSVGSRRFATADYELSYANLELPWSITHTYTYITGGFGAFSAYLDNPVFHIAIPGLHTFSPVIRMLARINPTLVGYSYDTLVYYTVRRESIAMPIRLNVYTYLGPLFDDFGWWGVFLVPLGMGFFSGRVFQRLLARPNFSAIATYSFFCLQFVYTVAAVITHANAILVSILALIVIRNYVSRQG